MKVEVSYGHLSRKEADMKAIKDIKNYLTEKQWVTLLAATMDPNTPISRLDIYFGFVGVRGYPFFAMMRKYRLEDLKAWIINAGGEVDANGFHKDLKSSAA